MLTEVRYRAPWYTKRIAQNRQIVKFLIDRILQHSEPDFPWSKSDLKYLKYDDLLEIAIATVNKNLEITLGAGSDYSNNVDAKFSVVRKNGTAKNPQYSALISGCQNKEHVFACVYEENKEKFYFFSFPVHLKQHSIPFDRDSFEPRLDNYMWQYKYDTFEEMALSKQ